MEVKKIIITVMAISYVFFNGCINNDNPVDLYNNGAEDGIYGTWTMTQMTFEVGTATYTVMASDSQKLTLVLNSDLTYHQKQISISSGVIVTTEEKGTYSISGTNLDQVSTDGILTSGSYVLMDDIMILSCTKISQGRTYRSVYHFKRENRMGDGLSLI